jgi:hypothetical protein
MNRPTAEMSDAKSEPTTRPWEAKQHGDSVQWAVTVAGREFAYIALTSRGNDKANAQFIVRAVNAHDALLEALQLVVGSLAFDREDATNREVLRRVRAAINLAEGL